MTIRDIQICTVVRIYNEEGTYHECRYDGVSHKNLPKDILEDLASSEVVCVDLMPNAEIFYFMKPKDWPENWTAIGTHN